MDRNDNLARAREFAEEVLGRLQMGTEDEVPAALLQSVEAVQRTAQRTRDLAQSPVRIGLVGEFSSGKSLLLGSLVGHVGVLPVREIPATGNVTALRFRWAAGDASTVGPMRVCYLDRGGLGRCLQHMLKEARSRVSILGVPSAIGDELAQRLESPELLGDHSAWKDIEAWIRAAWDVSRNPGWRTLLMELLTFVRAAGSCSLAVSGRRFELDPAMAADGLCARSSPDNLATLTFDELPGPELTAVEAPEAMTPSLLRATYPLIRRVEIEVPVATSVWPDHGDLSFELLDFPGLGAAESGVRDAFLCLEELGNVQTILILLNGKQPGRDDAQVIYDMLQAHRPNQSLRDQVLVGVGRFDQLPLGDRLTWLRECGEEDGGEGIDLDPEPLNERTLLENVETLRLAMSQAQSLCGDSDRVVFLSPVLQCARLASSGALNASEEFSRRLPLESEQAERIRLLWQGVVHALVDRGPVHRCLNDFVAGGGVPRLRSMIVDHVRHHGFAQLHRDVIDSYAELGRKLDSLREELGDQEADSADEATSVSRLLRSLAQEYARARSELQMNPPELSTGWEEDSESVISLASRKIRTRIAGWAEWDQLFRHADADGHVVFGSDDEDAPPIFDDIEGVLGEIPNGSEDFRPVFENVMKQSREESSILEEKAVGLWLAATEGRLTAHRLELSPLLSRLLGMEGAVHKKARILERCLAPAAFLSQIVDKVRQSESGFSTGDEDVFPLPDQRFFAWSNKARELSEKERPSRNASHMVQVLRLRHEMASIAAERIASEVSAFHQRALKTTVATFRKCEEVLRQLSADRELVDALEGPCAKIDREGGLRALVSLERPF